MTLSDLSCDILYWFLHVPSWVPECFINWRAGGGQWFMRLV